MITPKGVIMGSMRKCRLSNYKQGRLVEHFVAGTTAQAKQLGGMAKRMVAVFGGKFDELKKLKDTKIRASGEEKARATEELEAAITSGKKAPLRRSLR